MIKTFLTILAILYPFAVYWGLQHIDARILFAALIGAIGLRWLLGSTTSSRITVIVSLSGLALVALYGGIELGLKFYPAVINIALLVLFAGSLYFTPTIVERMARMQNPTLNEHGVVYTRRVTYAWCFFFTANGVTAAATALWASEAIWLLYNGFIAYLLIGIMFAGEWLIRRKVMSNNNA